MHRRGFTLLEVLIATAITTLLVVVLMSVVSGALSVWHRGAAQVDTFVNARQVLIRICDELQGAFAKSGQLEFTENAGQLQGTSAPQAGVSENLFFVTPTLNSAAGDLCAVAYRHNADTRTLQRAFIKSDDAFSSSLRYRVDGYSWTGAASPAAQWNTIAQGVIEFEIQSYSQQDLDNNTGPTAAWNSETASDPLIKGNVPRRIVVRLKLVDDKNAALLNTLPASSTAFTNIVTQNAREFTAGISMLPPH